MGALINYSHHPILPKSEAIRLGYGKYFDGFPCKNGHVSAREIIYTDRRINARGRCLECSRETASLSAFRKKQIDRDGFLTRRAELKRRDPEKTMLRMAQYRSTRKAIEFTITLADIKIPTNCPCCGTELKIGHGPSGRGATDASPSLDRINNGLGYVPGNVAVICNRCNMIKGHASANELEVVAKWLRSLEN